MVSGGSGLLCTGVRRTKAQRQAQATAAPAVGGSDSDAAVRGAGQKRKELEGAHSRVGSGLRNEENGNERGKETFL